MKKILFVLISIIAWYACSDNEPGIPEVSGVTFSDFLDERDSSVYRCITIGGQTWMAENLHYRLPWGSYGGCYSYMEEQADTTDFFADDDKFVEKVTAALESGELTDPNGKMKSYLNLVHIGMWNVSMFLARFVDFPETYAYLQKVNKELEIESINVVAVGFLDKAEKKNGGYKDENGFLYTYEAARKALPEGWELPDDEDWKKLEKALGMGNDDVNGIERWRGTAEGLLLKEGTDGIGFNIRMSGGKLYGAWGYAEDYQDREAKAYFWSSTEMKMNDSTDVVVIRKFQHNEDRIFRGTSKAGRVAYSVRGIKK